MDFAACEIHHLYVKLTSTPSSSNTPSLQRLTTQYLGWMAFCLDVELRRHRLLYTGYLGLTFRVRWMARYFLIKIKSASYSQRHRPFWGPHLEGCAPCVVWRYWFCGFRQWGDAFFFCSERPYTERKIECLLLVLRLWTRYCLWIGAPSS